MSRRRLSALLTGALLTTGLLALDVAVPDSRITASVRSLGATLTGPILTAVTDVLPAPAEHAAALAQTRAELMLAEDALAATGRRDELIGSAGLPAITDTGHQVVPARVVAVGTVGPAGPQRLTLNVGRDDGIAVDQSVVAADGLVGRTVAVGAATTDVLIVGAADLVVGARTEDGGLLGAVAPPAPGEQRGQGLLTFTAIDFGTVTPGERLLTLGSPGNAPFVPGIPIGVVTTLDPPTGRVGLTASVKPAVDVARLDVVVVVVPDGASAGGRSGQVEDQ